MGCGPPREIGEALQTQVRQMFHMRPIRREVERLLQTGQMCGVPKSEGVCREVLKRRQALWRFVRREGVEPTNNAAERAICPGSCGAKATLGLRMLRAPNSLKR